MVPQCASSFGRTFPKKSSGHGALFSLSWKAAIWTSSCVTSHSSLVFISLVIWVGKHPNRSSLNSGFLVVMARAKCSRIYFMSLHSVVIQSPWLPSNPGILFLLHLADVVIWKNVELRSPFFFSSIRLWPNFSLLHLIRCFWQLSNLIPILRFVFPSLPSILAVHIISSHSVFFIHISSNWNPLFHLLVSPCVRRTIGEWSNPIESSFIHIASGWYVVLSELTRFGFSLS